MRDKFSAIGLESQLPIDLQEHQEKLARIEHELRFLAERYLDVMLRMWSDSDQETRTRLEKLYADTTEDLVEG
jgi:hypothetical protein